jgi:hypothetical protein
MRTFSFLLVLSLLPSLLGHAQDSRGQNREVFLQQGQVIIFQDSTQVKAVNDTIIIVPPDSDYQILDYSAAQENTLRDWLTMKPDSGAWYADLYDLLESSVFIKDSARVVTSGGFVSARAPFKAYMGKTIREIHLKQVDIIEGSIWDTTRVIQTWLGRQAEALHVYTRPFVIRRFLDFTDGDTLSPSLLADNERFLREQPFIEDVRFVVQEIAGRDDAVDVLLIIKDRFAIGGEIGFSSLGKYNLGIFHDNVMGYGVQWRNSFEYDSGKNPAFGFSSTLRVNNLLPYHTDGFLTYADLPNYQEVGGGIDKRFINPQTRYGGGLSLQRVKSVDKFQTGDTTFVLNPYSRNISNIWFGRQFILGGAESRRNIIAALRFNRANYLSGPPVSRDTNFIYHDRDWLLGSLGYRQIKYYKSSLIVGYGETEDVPTGFLFELLYGYGWSQYEPSAYQGATFAAAHLFDSIGYLNFVIEGGVVNRDNTFENGVLNISSLYFTNLIPIWNFRFRQFVRMRYTKGFERYNLERISIGDNEGIRGLSGFELTGLQRLVFRLETLSFTPWTIAQFQTAFFVFGDIGFVGEGNLAPWEEDAYTGWGLGFRTRNNSLTFDTFQIRLGFYPRTPSGESNIKVEISFNVPQLFQNLQVGQPEIIEFR